MARGILDNRYGLGALLGQMFGGKRKMYDVFGYAGHGQITYEQMEGKYRRQDVASRIVEAPANALWSNPPIISANDEAWNDAWNKVVSKGLWKAISRVDKLAGMGDFAILLLGISGATNIDTPAKSRHVDAPLRDVLYFQPYAVSAVTAIALSQDVTSEDYMKPERYTIQQQSVVTQGSGDLTNTKGKSIAAKTINAHASRCLHVAENCLMNEVYGNPRLERVWNLLDDLLKVAGGTAETFWLMANRGMQVDVDKEMELTDEDAEALTQEVEDYIHQLSRFIRTRGVKVTSLGSDVPDPQNIFNMIIALISGATGIPKRILLGSEAGQLASQEDRNNWAERIEERRTEFGEPVIVWPLIRLLTNAGVLPRVEGLEVKIEWPNAFRTSPLERAQESSNRARAASNIAKAMEMNPKLISLDEGRAMLELTPQEPVVLEATASQS